MSATEAVIEIGDAVHHAPSGEKWVIARVEGEYVYPSGWPCARARLSDCTLITKATGQQRADMIERLRRLPATDPRHIAAEPVEATQREPLNFDQWLQSKIDEARQRDTPLTPSEQATRQIGDAGVQGESVCKLLAAAAERGATHEEIRAQRIGYIAAETGVSRARVEELLVTAGFVAAASAGPR